MEKLTLELVCFGHAGLNDYLLSLEGVLEVNIEESKTFIIDIKYDSKLISVQILKMEVLLFLDISKTPSIISFDKHNKNEVKQYDIVISDLCCEYCLMGMIDDLLMIDGIKKANSEFDVSKGIKENVIIHVYYDSKLINEEGIKKIELKFNS